jgi:2,3-bisphosphoglycerate-independent phosphoglycerate mutase
MPSPRAGDDFDFFFLHVKQTDQAGEDGDLAAKAAAIEEVDAALPRLLALAPDVVAITGDHSTPAPMRAHSFHPVPLLVASPPRLRRPRGPLRRARRDRGPARHLPVVRAPRPAARPRRPAREVRRLNAAREPG